MLSEDDDVADLYRLDYRRSSLDIGAVYSARYCIISMS